jgi:hypothetical protein
VIDPLADIEIEAECYDVKRVASLYFDTEGKRCWTKAWFNDREKGEPAVEVTRALAISFVNGTLTRDQWLSQFFPKQMQICQKAVEQTRQQLLSY